MSIDDEPTNLIAGAEPGGRWLVQNLGPDDIYIARNQSGCTPGQGVRVSENEAYEFAAPVRGYNGGAGIWACTDDEGEADVRVLDVG
jgi:hypothetical protein